MKNVTELFDELIKQPFSCLSKFYLTHVFVGFVCLWIIQIN